MWWHVCGSASSIQPLPRRVISWASMPPVWYGNAHWPAGTLRSRARVGVKVTGCRERARVGVKVTGCRESMLGVTLWRTPGHTPSHATRLAGQRIQTGRAASCHAVSPLPAPASFSERPARQDARRSSQHRGIRGKGRHRDRQADGHRCIHRHRHRHRENEGLKPCSVAPRCSQHCGCNILRRANARA
jgi:hypothetical protein